MINPNASMNVKRWTGTGTRRAMMRWLCWSVLVAGLVFAASAPRAQSSAPPAGSLVLGTDQAEGTFFGKWMVK